MNLLSNKVTQYQNPNCNRETKKQDSREKKATLKYRHTLFETNADETSDRKKWLLPLKIPFHLKYKTYDSTALVEDYPGSKIDK